MLHLDDSEKEQIIRLRYWVARAAESDSLNWWEDGSLTREGLYILERTYPFAPENAGRRLTLAGAAGRYAGIFETTPRALHLFRLDQDGEVEAALRYYDLSALNLPIQPVGSMDEFRAGLLSILGQPQDYTRVAERDGGRLQILPARNTIARAPLLLARIFAWAVLESQPGHPVYPYILDL